ncbi:MAG TPA: histidinol dehydrogenase [Steroidobacteraceae bacterium]
MRILEWQRLDRTARLAALARPGGEGRADISAQAARIIEAVRAERDNAVRHYTAQFDGVLLAQLRVSAAEIAAASAQLTQPQRAALERAIANVRTFHHAQLPAPLALETEPGVHCERLTRPIEAVGLYVPSGSAPLPSTVVMLAIPAAIAGCGRRVLCTPPRRDGSAHPAVLLAAQLCGVTEIFKIGGVQAIAALAYGTESVPRVAKIFGPGNAWVTAAKQQVAADPAGAACDMPAGPSEVLVIADDSARADFVASDLLAQCEHDPLSQALLVTTSHELADAVLQEVKVQQPQRLRREILARSMAASRVIIVADVPTGLAVSNEYAPEHLILQLHEARSWLPHVTNAGSVFIGPWSPEPLGDYCCGTNHVLPTYGYARAYSGLSVHDFMRRMTVQELSPQGLRSLGPTAATLAELEGLDAHAAAVNVRLEALQREAAP